MAETNDKFKIIIFFMCTGVFTVHLGTMRQHLDLGKRKE